MPEPAKIRTIADLESWIERSRREPVWIFKHSLTCGVSSNAWREFRDALADGSPAAAVIEVQNAREVSAETARRTGVRHESPQALLLRDGEVVWHASHRSIARDRLLEAAGPAARAPS